MNLSDCYYLGFISRIVDSKNQVILNLDVDSPPNYKNLESVFIQLNKADESPVPFFIQQVIGLKKNELAVELDLSNQIIDLNTLKGKSLYLPLSRLKKKDKHDYYFHEIIGFTAEDENLGNIGVITDVYDVVAHPIVAINLNGKEILVPLNDQTFIEVDREAKIFRLRTPEGLVDLYLN
jgi:16S rRNA processing protein RimM